MTPNDEAAMVEAIISALADYDPTPEEAAIALETAKGEWQAIRENRAEEDWIDRQRFDYALARKLNALAVADAARALK